MIELAILTLDQNDIVGLFCAYGPEDARRVLDAGVARLTHLVRLQPQEDIAYALEAAYAAGNGMILAAVDIIRIERTRSTSVGDLIAVLSTGEVFLVASFGFKPVLQLAAAEVQALRDRAAAL